MNGKEIGQGFQTEPVKLEHRNSADIIENTPEAYEKLLLDVLNGDGTNFTHWMKLRNLGELSIVSAKLGIKINKPLLAIQPVQWALKKPINYLKKITDIGSGNLMNGIVNVVC